MKIGDLVRHPSCQRNVCEETYKCGIILEMYQLDHRYLGEIIECSVLWWNLSNAMHYLKESLEVISGPRD